MASLSAFAPHVVRHAGELEEIRDGLLKSAAFVIDIESDIIEGGAKAQRNTVSWVGLGTRGEVHLIPLGHPKGKMIVPGHEEESPAFFHYDKIGEPDNEKRWTPSTRNLPMERRKPSMAKVKYKVPPTFGPPGPQMYPHEAYDILRPLLFSDIPKIGHNLKFDLVSSAKYYGGVLPPGPYHDTIIGAHVMNEWFMSYDLKSLICQWLGVGSHPNILNGFYSKTGGACNSCGDRISVGGDTFMWRGEDKESPVLFYCENCAGVTVDEWRQQGGAQKRNEFYPNLGKQGVDNFSMDQAARYLAKDVHFDWLYWKMLMRLIGREKLEAAYQFEMDLYPVLIDIECEGFPVDETIKQQTGDLLKADIADIEEEAWSLAGDQFSLSNPGAKRYLLFGEGGSGFGLHKRKMTSESLRVFVRTPKTRQPVLNQAVLDYYAGDSRMAELFLRWSEMEKLRGTFIDGLDRWMVDGKVYTSFKQHGTVTSRLSAHEPNLHQLPRGTSVRKFFVAGEGYLLVVSDYDQIELRTMADMAGDEAMITIFQQGRDIHREAAAVMLQVRPEDINDVQRQIGKTVNFGTGYGAGAKKVAATAGTSIPTAEKFIERYYNEYSGLLPWKERLLKEARARGDRKNVRRFPPYVEIPPFGRRRRLPDLFNYSREQQWTRFRAERQAVNAVVQGFAANITKLAMIDLHTGLRPFGAKMLVQVHDEIIVKAEEDRAKAVLDEVVSEMAGVLDPTTGIPILERVPLIASAKTGVSWSAAK